jgi:hypothetical protein
MVQMIARETSVLHEIIDLDPELNGDAEYFRVRFRRDTLRHRIRQFACSPVVLTIAAVAVLLMIAANL